VADGAQRSLPLEAPAPVESALARRDETAAADVARGVCRTFHDLGFQPLVEMRLASGRRVDVIGLDRKGRFAVAEIKTSLGDFRADRKWREYLAYCDLFFFAVASGFPRGALPAETGLIVADRFGGDVLRPGIGGTMIEATRRRQTLLFALKAGGRLYRSQEPAP